MMAMSWAAPTRRSGHNAPVTIAIVKGFEVRPRLIRGESATTNPRIAARGATAQKMLR
jgi:hypothetical protein